MTTTSIPAWLTISQDRVFEDLIDACQKLDSVDNELLLDFSSIRRMNPNALTAIEALAENAEKKSVRVTLCGVNVNLYRVFKLVGLTRRLRFVN
jgi:anti-anti-sigma regulatory factor